MKIIENHLPVNRLFVLLCLLVLFPTNGTKSAELCRPYYEGYMMLSLRTDYYPKMTKNRAKIYGTPVVSRIFQGWEKLKMRIVVKNFEYYKKGKKCISSDKEDEEWFKRCKIIILDLNNEKTFLEKSWESLSVDSTLKSVKSKNYNNTREGDIIIEEREVLLKDSKDKPLGAGIYKIRFICDTLDTKKSSESSTKRFVSKKIGESVFEVIVPKTDKEMAEEEMHRAYWSGIHTEKAIPHLEKVIKIDKNALQAFSWLSRAYLDNGKIDSAADTIKRCLELDPKNRACREYSSRLKSEKSK
jgi:tetratricopeptide (TPR) repeat protein